MTTRLPARPRRSATAGGSVRRRAKRLAAALFVVLFAWSLAGPLPGRLVLPSVPSSGAQLRAGDIAASDRAVLPTQPGPERALAEPVERPAFKLAQVEPTPLLASEDPALAPKVGAGERRRAAGPTGAGASAASQLRNRSPPRA